MKRSFWNRRSLSLLAAVLATAAGPSTQVVAAEPPVSNELRVIYAGPPEITEGRRVAQKSCAGCHGTEGLASIKGIPHLAGQRAAYLLAELRAYKDSVRSDASMSGAVKFLSDNALFVAAAYYASLDPAQPANIKAAPAKPDAAAAGKAAAAGCAGCHGDAGISSTPGVPSLVGLYPAYLVAAMTAYKNGQRKDEMMKTLVSGLSDQEMKNIALFYSLQKPGAAQTPHAGNQAAGKAAASACASCHGESGVSGNPMTPSLAGQDSQYLQAAIQDYKQGTRTDATMKGAVATFDERVGRDLAAYYASQKPQAPNVPKPLTTAEWAQRCDRCHGVNGNSTDLRVPALAAQRIDYLEKALMAYKSGARKSAQMSAMVGTLGDDDIAGLAAYYSRQKQRAVIFVQLPAK